MLVSSSTHLLFSYIIWFHSCLAPSPDFGTFFPAYFPSQISYISSVCQSCSQDCNIWLADSANSLLIPFQREWLTLFDVC